MGSVPVLDSFMSTCHTLESFWKREPQLRLCYRLVVLRAREWHIVLADD